MASADFGGKITFKLSNGVILAGRGTFTVMAARMSSEAVTNDDASLARVLTPKPATIEISMQDDGQDFEALVTGTRFNFTAVEESNGVTHLLSNAFMTGDPSINRKNGEVTGLSLAGENYQRIS
jgi:Phage tail tube protein